MTATVFLKNIHHWALIGWMMVSLLKSFSCSQQEIKFFHCPQKKERCWKGGFFSPQKNYLRLKEFWLLLIWLRSKKMVGRGRWNILLWSWLINSPENILHQLLSIEWVYYSEKINWQGWCNCLIKKSSCVIMLSFNAAAMKIEISSE